MQRSNYLNVNVDKINDKALRKARLSRVLYYIFSILLALIFIFPFVFMINKSLMGNLESMSLPVKFFPEGFNLASYTTAFDAKLLKYFGNTAIVMVSSMVFGTLSASLCAYGFTKIKWAGRGVWFAIVLSTMMMPGIVLQIPLYIMFLNVFNWIDTLYPLIVPSILGGGALNIFLITQFMRGLPKEIDEAATIDGAGTLIQFFRIILPLCKPILVFVVVNAFLGAWNDFMGPLVYISDENNFTIPVGVYFKYTGQNLKDAFPNMQMATGVMLALPTIIVFFIFQRQLIDGVTMGSIKG